MIGKRVVLSASALALALVAAVPGVAFAGPSDNNNARIGGVSASSPADCPSGYFCVYTGPNYTGRMYKLYHCRRYYLYDWNGWGSHQNNNVPAVSAVFQDRRFRVIAKVMAKDDPQRPPYVSYENASYNFKPVWYIKPC
jgi:hypothetical protein